MGNPIVLGIDPGSQTTGFGVITQRGTHLTHIANGSFSVRPNESLHKRLHFIYRKVCEVIKQTSPHVVAIESIFYAKNVRSVITLAHARGVILLAASQSGLPIAEYSPMEIKRATVGYGRATKEQVMDMICRLFRLSKSEDSFSYDQSDALAVALCHLNTFQSEQKLHMLSKYEQPAVQRSKVQW